MFRNYAIAALRNLARNPLYAALNIGGVALEFTATLLIALYVRDELSYEKFIPGYRDTYLVATTGTPPEGHAPIKSFSTPSHVASWINLDLATVASAARLTSSNGQFENRGKPTLLHTAGRIGAACYASLHSHDFANSYRRRTA